MERDKNQYNEHGFKHGYWEEGLIFKRSGDYKNGERQGLWKEETTYMRDNYNSLYQAYNFEKGTEYVNFENGERNGITKLYDKDGILIKENFYKNNKIIGEQKDWFQGSGEIKAISYYDNNSNPCGDWIVYYKIGRIKRTINFINSITHTKSFDVKGNIEHEHLTIQ